MTGKRRAGETAYVHMCSDRDPGSHDPNMVALLKEQARKGSGKHRIVCESDGQRRSAGLRAARSGAGPFHPPWRCSGPCGTVSSPPDSPALASSHRRSRHPRPSADTAGRAVRTQGTGASQFSMRPRCQMSCRIVREKCSDRKKLSEPVRTGRHAATERLLEIAVAVH